MIFALLPIILNTHACMTPVFPLGHSELLYLPALINGMFFFYYRVRDPSDHYVRPPQTKVVVGPRKCDQNTHHHSKDRTSSLSPPVGAMEIKILCSVLIPVVFSLILKSVVRVRYTVMFHYSYIDIFAILDEMNDAQCVHPIIQV